MGKERGCSLKNLNKPPRETNLDAVHAFLKPNRYPDIIYLPIAHVRYTQNSNMTPRRYGHIEISSRFLCPSIPTGDLHKKKAKPNIEV